MAKPKPQRSRVFIPIPSNWDNLTQEQRDAAVLEIAEALQRQLGVTNGKVDQRKAVDAVIADLRPHFKSGDRHG